MVLLECLAARAVLVVALKTRDDEFTYNREFFVSKEAARMKCEGAHVLPHLGTISFTIHGGEAKQW